MCNLTDFTESQLRLIQNGISEQIADNNIHIEQLENTFDYTLLSHNPDYMRRQKLNDDLWQCATKILEALVSKKMESIITCN